MTSDDSQNSVIQFFNKMEATPPPNFTPLAKGINLDDDSEDTILFDQPCSSSSRVPHTTHVQNESNSTERMNDTPSRSQLWQDYRPNSANQYGTDIHISPMLLRP